MICQNPKVPYQIIFFRVSFHRTPTPSHRRIFLWRVDFPATFSFFTFFICKKVRQPHARKDKRTYTFFCQCYWGVDRGRGGLKEKNYGHKTLKYGVYIKSPNRHFELLTEGMKIKSASESHGGSDSTAKKNGGQHQIVILQEIVTEDRRWKRKTEAALNRFNSFVDCFQSKKKHGVALSRKKAFSFSLSLSFL